MHLGIIMDGNRRWAKKRRLTVLDGHFKGAEKVKEVVRWCVERRIKVLTLFAFSTENWKRSQEEVNFLMRLANEFIVENLKELQQEGARVRFLGRKEGFSQSLLQEIKNTETLTCQNDRIALNILFNYGGRAEIVDAVKQIIQAGIPPERIDEERIGNYLYTAGLPDPDLIIRTSGEQRLSNFLTWQSAYSELYFCKKYWPDFSEKDLDEALADYAFRQRRFGK